MTIAETINADLTSAMKKQDELERGALRLVRSALKNKEIDLRRPLTDEDVLAVLKTMKKQYEDALADFKRGGRADLVEKQEKEIAVVARYLPAELPDAEIEKIVRGQIAALGASSPGDVGKVMGAAMKEIAGRADGTRVREAAQRLLAS